MCCTAAEKRRCKGDWSNRCCRTRSHPAAGVAFEYALKYQDQQGWHMTPWKCMQHTCDKPSQHSHGEDCAQSMNVAGCALLLCDIVLQ